MDRLRITGQRYHCHADTHTASTTAGTLARRGHAKSKRSDLRVVGLGMLVSETGHVPLLYRIMLVSLVRLALGARLSALGTMKSLAQVEATLVRTVGSGRGRRPTTLLLPDLTADQAKAAKLFELNRWAPGLLSTSAVPRRKAWKEGVS